MYPDISLSEIAEINPPRPQLSLEPEAEVSFVPMGDVTDSGRWHSRQVRKFQEVNKGYTCFLNNDVLFAKITPCMENGKGCLVIGLENNVGFGSTEFHVLRARTNADSGFIYQWSIYIPFRLKAAASMTGSAGQQRVPASFLETFKIPVIEKPEQAKIAEILSTVDRAIEQTEALIAKQQRINTGLMQDLLTRGIDEHGNFRSEQTHKFKDSPLGRIPVEWEVGELGELCEVTSSKRIFFRDYRTDGIPFYRSKEIIELTHEGTTTGELFIEERKFNEIAKKFGVPSNGDILISSVGTLGICYLVKETDRFYFKDGNLIWFRQFQRPINRVFLVTLLPPMIELQFDNMVIGTSQKAFTIEKLKRLKLSLPQPAEEERLAKAIQQIQSACECEIRSLQKLRSLKTALMQDLLTGNKPVTPLLND